MMCVVCPVWGKHITKWDGESLAEVLELELLWMLDYEGGRQ